MEDKRPLEDTIPFENNRGPADHSHIKGWGIDADPKNDPTYPMKKRTNGEHEGYTWERPTQQPVNMEVLYSIERPNMTAVFGTAAPLRGLSGAIRRMAYKRSENEYSHWLPLILADRVDVVEGVIDDFKHGKIPNIFAEKGYVADWHHNKSGLLARVAILAGITAAVVMLARSNSRD
ncbi:hypothetical protein KB205_13545 [Microvirga sp. STS03]|uniref:hypothetical protein n=1 Tax=Pontibacter TaxID=323449 RepID=UPI001B82351E|nr:MULTISPECIES: hypothetical protein [Pontibacter]MBR0571655.1 hypothetical protein [Microvirga sp. STS03]